MIAAVKQLFLAAFSADSLFMPNFTQNGISVKGRLMKVTSFDQLKPFIGFIWISLMYVVVNTPE